jgi:hypothetical protein
VVSIDASVYTQVDVQQCRRTVPRARQVPKERGRARRTPWFWSHRCVSNIGKSQVRLMSGT